MSSVRSRPGLLSALGLVALVALAGSTGAWASHTFPDVPDSNVFHDDIAWMAENDIADGFADGGFHPSAAVSRQAMSAFMHRESQHTLERAVGDRAIVTAPAVMPQDPSRPFAFSGEFIHAPGVTGPVCGAAPIDLPDGAVLEEIGFTGVDAGPGEVAVTLRAEELFLSNSPLVLGEVFSSGATGLQHPTDTTTVHTVDLVNNSYFVNICVEGNDAQDYGFTQAYVTYSLET